MDPAQPSKHKRNVSDFLSDKLNKVLRRSPSPSASQKSSRASSNRSPSSPLPGGPTSLPSHTQSASLPANEDVFNPHASVLVSRPMPTASASAPVSLTHETPTIVVSPVVEDSSPDEGVANSNTIVDFIPDKGPPIPSGLWAGLGIALRALHKNTGMLPPLQSAIGALIDCLDIWEVSDPIP